MATRLVIETTRAGLRVAVADVRAGRPHLMALRSHPAALTVDAAAQLQAWLKNVPRAGVQAVLVIAREQVIVRAVKFPSTQPAELAQMVELYVKAQLPYPREQAVVDFALISQAAGFSTVAVVACQREIVDRQLAVLQQAGVAVAGVTVSSWGVLEWYRLAAAAGAEEPVLIVNVDEARTDFVLAAEGRLRSSRSVAQGAQDWQGTADVAELLAVEVDRSRAAVQKELPGTDVRSVLLTGSGALASWKEGLAPRLGLPVAVWPAQQPFGGVPLPEGAAMSPVVVGGLALASAEITPNLSPPELRIGLRHREQVRQLATLGLLLAASLALAAGLFGVQWLRQRRVADRLDRVLAEVGPAAKQVQEELRAVQLVDAVFGDRQRLAQVIAGVFRVTPPSVALDVLTFERSRGEFVLRGSAGSTQDVLEYLQQLQSIEGVGSAELKFSTRRTTAAGERTDFEVALRRAPSAAAASAPAGS